MEIIDDLIKEAITKKPLFSAEEIQKIINDRLQATKHKVFLVSGWKRTGKSTVGDIFVKAGAVKLYFATPLKSIIADTFDMSLETLEYLKNEQGILRHDIDDLLNAGIEFQSYRTILQRFGTEAMKKVFGERVWAKLAAEKADNLLLDSHVVISDWRFNIEYEEMKKVADVVTIRVNRFDSTKDTHSSERELDYFNFDYVIENRGTLEELEAEVKEIIEKEMK